MSSQNHGACLKRRRIWTRFTALDWANLSLHTSRKQFAKKKGGGVSLSVFWLMLGRPCWRSSKWWYYCSALPLLCQNTLPFWLNGFLWPGKAIKVLPAISFYDHHLIVWKKPISGKVPLDRNVSTQCLLTDVSKNLHRKRRWLSSESFVHSP